MTTEYSIPLCWDAEDVPLNRLVELLEVDPELHNIGLVLLLGVLLRNLVRPDVRILMPEVNL